MAVISLAETKEWLDVTNTDDDTLITALIERVSEFIENQTGRFFGTATAHTEHLPGTGTNELWLNEPADTITSVEERSFPGDTWTTITEGDDDGFELLGRRLLRKGGARWIQGRQYRVIYQFGYATAPEDIRQLALDLVKLKYGEAQLEYSNLQSFQIGDTRWSRGTMSDRSLMSVPFVAETIGHWRGIKRGVA